MLFLKHSLPPNRVTGTLRGDSQFGVRVRGGQRRDFTKSMTFPEGRDFSEQPCSIGQHAMCCQQQKLKLPLNKAEGDQLDPGVSQKRCSGTSGTNGMRGSHGLRTFHFLFCFSQRMCSILSTCGLAFSTFETLLERNGAA